MRSKKLFSAAKPTFVIFIALFLVSAIAPAHAQTFKVLHTFHGPNGNGPASVLTRDSAGNLYGTTEAGGTGKCGNFGCGTAFKLNKSGKQVWLHSFNVVNGEEPFAGLLRDATGNLYGTTDFGGNTACTSGCGTVFKLDGSGKETVLHKFKGSPDGWTSDSLLARDPLGNLYGTTEFGGKNDNGIIFKVDKQGKYFAQNGPFFLREIMHRNLCHKNQDLGIKPNPYRVRITKTMPPGFELRERPSPIAPVPSCSPMGCRFSETTFHNRPWMAHACSLPYTPTRDNEYTFPRGRRSNKLEDRAHE